MAEPTRQELELMRDRLVARGAANGTMLPIVELALEALDLRAIREDAAELRRNALPSNCTRCNGRGSDPPHCPESGPCERCGGWTTHKRLFAGEVASLRAKIEELRADAELACETPPPRCACPGCSLAREQNGVTDVG